MTASTAVRERPILFSGPMVRAILDGSKTQTRRVLTPQPDGTLNHGYPQRVVDRFRCVGTDVASGKLSFEAGNFAGPMYAFPDGRDSVKADILCPYGQPGDRLWVRETHTLLADPFAITPGINYEADDTLAWNVPMPDGLMVYNVGNRKAWKRRPSIFMLRAHSRLTLEITGVRVERVQDITANDCIAEGIPSRGLDRDGPCIAAALIYIDDYQKLWDSLNASRGYGWDANPWVWVVEFRKVDA
jgi:hypothetical protein